jgi:hypothetical protein
LDAASRLRGKKANIKGMVTVMEGIDHGTTR